MTIIGGNVTNMRLLFIAIMLVLTAYFFMVGFMIFICVMLIYFIYKLIYKIINYLILK